MTFSFYLFSNQNWQYWFMIQYNFKEFPPLIRSTRPGVVTFFWWHGPPNIMVPLEEGSYIFYISFVNKKYLNLKSFKFIFGELCSSLRVFSSLYKYSLSLSACSLISTFFIKDISIFFNLTKHNFKSGLDKKVICLTLWHSMGSQFS